MKFGCYCGHLIIDNSDDLRYKGYIIADQDWDDVWTWVEKLENLKDVDRKKIFDEFASFLGDVTMKTLYQCPECGRLYLQYNRQMYTFVPEFVPEKGTGTHLLQSYLESDWKGHLSAWWREEIVEWNPHKGAIYVDVNRDQGRSYFFDEYREFEEEYYRLFYELKDVCLKTSTLHVEHRTVHSWLLEKDDKEGN